MRTSRPGLSIASGLCFLVGVTGCGSDDTSLGLGDASTVPVVTLTPSTIASTGSSSVSSTEPVTTLPEGDGGTTSAPHTPDSTTVPDDPIGTAVAVAATSNGVVVDGGANTWDTVVIDDTTMGTPRLIDGFVIYQGTDAQQPAALTGPILVSNGVETREFTDGNRDLVLHDVGHVDGAAVILASSRTPMPPNPDAVDDRLLLIDASTFDVTDLGKFEGWETSITSARFGDDAISLAVAVNTSNTIEVIEFDGTRRHTIALPGEGGYSLVDFGGSVWAVDAGFREPDFDEFLQIFQINLDDGSVREATIDVDLSGLGERAADGFCAHVDFLDGQMMCDQTVGAPFTFPIDGDAVASPVPGLDNGTPMFRASQ